MVQIEEIKEDNALAIDTLINISKEEINKLKEIKILFKNIYDTLSNDEKDKIRSRIYEIKQIFNHYMKLNKKLSKKGRKISKAQCLQINKTKVGVNRLHAYLKNKAQANNNKNNVQVDPDTYLSGLNELFNYNDYYKPIKTRSAFNDNYELYVSNGDENSSINEYFDKIIIDLQNLINIKKEQGEWKLQITMKIIFISFNDNDKQQIMYTKSDNVNIMRGYATNDIINELFYTFKTRYQAGLETRMVGSNFTFDHIDYLEYHFNKINLNRGSTYIPLPKHVANKKCIINPKNTKDNACFAYAIMVALNHTKIANNPQRISNIMRFINNYNWTNIDFPAGPSEYKAFEKYNDNIALNIFCYVNKENEIRPVFISKNNKTRNYHANLLMISNEKGTIWHYTAIKSISALNLLNIKIYAIIMIFV